MTVHLHMGTSEYDKARERIGKATTDAIAEALRDVEVELVFAVDRFAPFNSPHEGYAVVLEELDEAWDEIKANRALESLCEMNQVAAMAVRYLVDIGPRVNPWPLRSKTGDDQ